MRKHRRYQQVLAVFCGSLILASCTATQAPAASSKPATSPAASAQPASSAAPSDAASAAPSEAEFVGTKTFTFPFSSPGISDVPLRAAFASLNEQGWSIDPIVVPDPDILAQGLSRGEFAFSHESTTGALIAAGAGIPIKIVAAYARNAWTMYSTTDITECAGLDGKKVAIHSEAASTTAMQRTWVETECPGTEPEVLVIPGSPNRAAALLAGEIDATSLELSDTVALEAEDDGDQFHLLTSFADGLPGLQPSTLYTTQEFLDNNPDTVKGVIRALLEVHRQIADDPEYLREITLEHYPEVDEATLDEVVALYAERDIFPVNGELTEDDLEFTIGFYEDAGVVEPGLTAADVAGLGPLNEVLDEIGRQ